MGVLVTPVLHKEFSVLGVRVDAVQNPELIAPDGGMDFRKGRAHYIA